MDTQDTDIFPEISKAKREEGRLLFARDVDFMKSAVSLETLPSPDLPEVCFAGRSNVGKSSLINALTNRKGIARASNTPGRTRELNYFNVDGRLFLVDLPGFGYAKASKTELAKVTDKTLKFIAKRPAAFPTLMITSSEKKDGIDILRAEIADLALPANMSKS